MISWSGASAVGAYATMMLMLKDWLLIWLKVFFQSLAMTRWLSWQSTWWESAQLCVVVCPLLRGGFVSHPLWNCLHLATWPTIGLDNECSLCPCLARHCLTSLLARVVECSTNQSRTDLIWSSWQILFCFWYQCPGSQSLDDGPDGPNAASFPDVTPL